MRKPRLVVVAVLTLVGASLYFSWPLEHSDHVNSVINREKPLSRPTTLVSAPGTPKVIASATQATPGIQVFDRPGQEPAWAVPYGDEFWRPGMQMSGNLNFGSAIDRVKHSFAADKRPLDVKGAAFAVELDNRGFRFSPFLPNAADGKSSPQPGVSLRMETASIRAGTKDLYRAGSEPLAWSINGNIAQGLLSAENQIVEHYDVRTDGVSVTWLLNEKPKVSGDVEIRWRYDGLRLGGVTASGHHFYDGAGKARVRVGQATAVDSRGQSVSLRTEAQGNALVVKVPQSVIDSAGYPLAIDPTVSAEFELDRPVWTPTSDTLNEVVTSYNGTDWLAVWNSGNDIYAMTVASDGSPYVTNTLTISNATGEQNQHQVAVNDQGDWLVTWDDKRSGNTDIYGALVSADGRILTAENGFIINAESGSQISEALASSGSQWLAVWAETSSEKLHAMVIGADGTAQLPAKVQVGDELNQTAVLAAVGTGYYLAWRDARNGGPHDIFGTFISAAGVPVNPSGSPVVTAALFPGTMRITSRGTDCLLVWEDGRSGNTDLYGMIIGADGTLGTEFVIVDQNSNQSLPSIATNGSNYVVVWGDPRNGGVDIYGTLISPSGVVASADGAVICDAAGNQNTAVVAGVGSDFMVVWNDFRSGAGCDIYGAILNSAGTIQQANGFSISDSAGDQVTPTISPCVADALVTWSDYTVGTNIYGASVYLDASVSPVDGTLLSDSANTEENVTMAASGSTWFVAWEDNRNEGSSGLDIYGMFVDANGDPSSTNGILISDATGDQTGPAISANGSDAFLVAWETEGADPAIYASVIDTVGTILQEDGFLVEDPTGAGDPANLLVTGNGGDNWLVTYSVAGSLYGEIIEPNTNMNGLSGQIGSDILTPCAAGSTTEWLVVWSGATSADIECARIAANGVVTSVPQFSATENQFDPVVTFNGNRWFLAWTDNRFGTDDIVYGWVRDDLSDLVYSFIEESDDAGTPAIAAFGNEGALLVWNSAPGDPDGEIHGLAISSTGAPLNGGTFSVSGEPEDTVSNPKVSGNFIYGLVAWESGGKVFSAKVTPDGEMQQLGSTDGDASLSSIALTSNAALAAFTGTDADGFQHWTGTNRAAAQTFEFGTAQTVTFANVPDQVFKTSPITLTGFSTSSLPVTFEVVSGPGTIAGNQLTLTGVGELTLMAVQVGDSTYERATKTQTVLISTRSQSISFASIGNKNFGKKPITLSASSNVGLGVSFRVVSGPARISGNQLTMTDLGSVQVQAFNSGSSTTQSASVVQSFRIVDTTKPELQTDESVQTGRDRTKIEGKVTDNHRADAVKFRVKPPGGNFGGFRKVRLGGNSDSRRFDLSVSTPDSGAYLVELYPLDEAGNKGSKVKVKITRD